MVSTCEELGQFFGQFGSRSINQLKEIEMELLSVYGSSEIRPRLLYADVGNHIGDNGVVKAENNKFYRVEIMEELSNNEVKTH